MNTRAKASIIATVLVASNWHWSSSTKTPNSSTWIHLDGATIATAVCSIALVVSLVRLKRILRAVLDKPVRIPKSRRLFSWDPVLILFLLLCFSFNRVETTTPAADTVTTISRGYGCEASVPLFFIAAAMLLTFQAHRELRRFYERAQDRN